MLKKIESLINKSPLYNIIRFNFFTDALVETKTKRTKKAIDFFSSFFETSHTNKLIYDIGANKGSKVKAFLKMGYTVVAIEPEKKALSTLRWRFCKNKKVTIVPHGVSDIEGTLVIHIAESRSGLNTLSDKWVNTLETEQENRWHKRHSFKKSYEVKVTTLDHLFATYGLPYFIKIDVEGYENKVIKGMSQLPPMMSFETNLPEFLDETIESLHHLTALSGQLLFNYSVSDQLVLNKWVPGKEMLNIIKDPSIRYMEIICRNRE